MVGERRETPCTPFKSAQCPTSAAMHPNLRRGVFLMVQLALLFKRILFMEITLGSKVKDSVTGFTGIAIGRTIWLHGCARIMVQPEGVNKEGKTYESQSFDEPQLVVLKKAAKKEGAHNTGGPRPNVFQKEMPHR
jgi:hypothetical protein